MRSILLASLVLALTAPPALAADPLEAELIALETQSWHAWQDHDAAFFERFLSSDHVEYGPFGPSGRGDVITGVAAGCTVKTWSVDHFRLTRFDERTALLVYRARQDTTCGTVHVPSPAWATSLYIFRDGRWQLGEPPTDLFHPLDPRRRIARGRKSGDPSCCTRVDVAFKGDAR